MVGLETPSSANINAAQAPSILFECDHFNQTVNCVTLSLKDGIYTGLAQQGQSVRLAVEKWDGTSVILNRLDEGGSMPEVSGRYIGTILSDGSIIGTVAWSWPGHFSEIKGMWTAGIGSDDFSASTSSTLPAKFIECDHEEGKSNCALLSLQDGEYRGKAQLGQISEYHVAEWRSGEIVLDREDREGPTAGFTARYVGKLLPDGSMEGKATWMWPFFWVAPRNRTWVGNLNVSPIMFATLSKSSSSSNTETAQSAVCTSRQVRRAMQTILDNASDDPNGKAMALLAIVMIGDTPHQPKLIVVDSKNGNDPTGQYTSAEAHSFVCRGLIVEQGGRVDSAEDADGAAVLSANAINKLMANNPSIVTWFVVAPVGTDKYHMTFIDTGHQLSRAYDTTFSIIRH